jgi:hypothetical protein
MSQVVSPGICPPLTNTAFVFRLIWDSAAQNWRIVIKPVNGGRQRVFVDLESAFFYVSQLYPE